MKHSYDRDTITQELQIIKEGQSVQFKTLEPRIIGGSTMDSWCDKEGFEFERQNHKQSLVDENMRCTMTPEQIDQLNDNFRLLAAQIHEY